MQENRKLRRKVRNSYIVSTVSIALVLFLLGSVGYLIISALDATDRIKESVSVYVMLKDDISPEQTQAITKNLEAQEHVRLAVFVPKDKAAEEFMEYDGTDFTQFLDFNPLPDSFEVKLKASGPDADVLSGFEKTAMAWPGVDEVVYQKKVVEEIGNNINKFNLVLVVYGFSLLIISLILLNNTIKVSILSKRYIISTMKLVGATRWFITRPFLGSAFLQGIYSAIIASLLFTGMVYGVREGLPEIDFAAANSIYFWIIGGMFITGILISLMFTSFAVRKFIRMPTGAIHYY